jgi:selenocysteine-specific elongation factor
MAVDHCFAIKGKGTVLTGTILQGKLVSENVVEIPSLNEQRKIKSIQMFKKPVKSAKSGDRIGTLVTQLESSRFERGFIAEPNFVKNIDTIISSFHAIRFYKRSIATKSKLHVTVGHSTVMGILYLFRGKYPGTDFEYVDSVDLESDLTDIYVRIDLELSVACYESAKLIASKLDTDIRTLMLFEIF